MDRPAADWTPILTGRSRTAQFAATIANYAPTYIYSSTETKAGETAARISASLDIPTLSWPGLQEDDRRHINWCYIGRRCSSLPLSCSRLDLGACWRPSVCDGNGQAAC
ncbi:MAG: histidine phosphatase family protein [Anaerolineales bacterium]|nr:histidine phosphatase family protein [Anaerolineales bacterium]MCB0013717.1 histidine phosphatase family protein [Anaerolineales bacterium]MCB0016936.1 histidine phosphatase family protein [Anaerolineales bacterium]MCB0027305.1 histidine phosphatase family protein [Anaerolineales bacterium]